MSTLVSSLALLLVIVSTWHEAAAHEIRLTVTDQQGEPVEGVTVLPISRQDRMVFDNWQPRTPVSNAARSDGDGAVSLELSPDHSALVFLHESGVAMIPLGRRDRPPSLNVRLQPFVRAELPFGASPNRSREALVWSDPAFLQQAPGVTWFVTPDHRTENALVFDQLLAGRFKLIDFLHLDRSRTRTSSRFGSDRTFLEVAEDGSTQLESAYSLSLRLSEEQQQLSEPPEIIMLERVVPGIPVGTCPRPEAVGKAVASFFVYRAAVGEEGRCQLRIPPRRYRVRARRADVDLHSEVELGSLILSVEQQRKVVRWTPGEGYEGIRVTASPEEWINLPTPGHRRRGRGGSEARNGIPTRSRSLRTS